MKTHSRFERELRAHVEELARRFKLRDVILRRGFYKGREGVITEVMLDWQGRPRFLVHPYARRDPGCGPYIKGRPILDTRGDARSYWRREDIFIKEGDHVAI